jgi:hypothetical protein
MRENPERIAWIVLLTSFFICVGLAVAVPLGIRHYVRHAQIKQLISLEVQRPPLSVTLAGRGLPLSVSESYGDIPERTIVTVGAAAGRLVTYIPRGNGQGNNAAAMIAQLYDNTKVVLESARSPRFSISPLPHEVIFTVQDGRVRINVSDNSDRPTVVYLHVPHGEIALDAGTYWVNVTPTTTEITVREGQAQIVNRAAQNLSLDQSERAIVETNQILGPLSAARNLIRNSGFSIPLEETWISYNKDIQIEGEPKGEIEQTEVEGRPAVSITRQGTGHIETGITQQLETDIRDFSFLQLHLLLKVVDHNVPVCGSLGSECPIMVRIDYRDADGNDQQWLQGFYAEPASGLSNNPGFCVTCGIRNEHIQVPPNTWYSYDSENLIPLLSQDGKSPTLIKSITVYASGHAYQSIIAEVELIGQE